MLNINYPKIEKKEFPNLELNLVEPMNKFKNTKNVVIQTLLNHVDVILHHNDTNNVDLFVRKSFSEHLWLWINDSSSFL